MNRIENNSQLSFFNPYRVAGASPVVAIAQNNMAVALPKTTLVDRAVNWGKAILFRDYEKGLDIVDKGTWLLDKGVVVVVGSMQAAVIADGLFHLNILKNGFLSFIPYALKLLLTPASIFFIVIGVIEAIFEIINLRKGVKLLNSVNKEKSPMDGFEFIKDRYFTLQKEESQKIIRLIEEKLPDLDQTAKADRFDEIAKRALEIKFDNLKRRISPGLAEEVKVQLDSIMKELQSPDETIRNAAETRAKLLMESVSRQAKNKIIIHILGIVAIFFTVLSAIGMATGIGAIGFFVAMGACTAIAVITKWIIQKGLYEREVANFYDRVTQLKEVAAAS